MLAFAIMRESSCWELVACVDKNQLRSVVGWWAGGLLLLLLACSEAMTGALRVMHGLGRATVSGESHVIR